MSERNIQKRSVIQEHNGKFCSKRILALGFGVAAIVGFFFELDSQVIMLFAGISVGNHVLTTKQFENHG